MEKPILSEGKDKEVLFDTLIDFAENLGLKIADTDPLRPWGGWIHFSDESTKKFLKLYFQEINLEELYRYGQRLRPKFLLVAPERRLSWQYHDRRAELWKVVVGPVGVRLNDTDEQPDTHETYSEGTLLRLDPHLRHRLIGLNRWGLIAEIWQHTDLDTPSEEEDIVRLEDDYGRN